MRGLQVWAIRITTGAVDASSCRAERVDGIAPHVWFGPLPATLARKGGSPRGRILDLHKQELSISGLSSGRQQTLAPLGTYSQRISGM